MSQDDFIPDDLIVSYKRAGVKQTNNQTNSLQNGGSPPTCDINDASKGRIVGYKSGGGGIGGPVTDSSFTEMVKLLQSINEYLSLMYEAPTDSWFEAKVTTTSVTPDQLDTVPNPTFNADQTTTNATPGYNFLNVNNGLQGRNAIRLYIVNDGPGNMYLRTSIDGRSFSPEFQMINGEKRVVWNVYEVRYRSNIDVPVPAPGDTIGPGNTMRVSEREIYTPYVTIVNNTSTNTTNTTIPGELNKSNFIARAQTIVLPFMSTQLSSTVIPDGYSVVITNNKNNTTDMFVSRTDAMSVANRVTVGIGDSISLEITNTNLVFVAFALANQVVEILAEQN